MPNCSSTFLNWPMNCNAYSSMKTRNLLQNLQVLPDRNSSTPMPPPFQDFIMLTKTKPSSTTNSNINSVNYDEGYKLPHQTPSPLLDRTNYKYSNIRARPLYHFQYNQSNIWTQPTSNLIYPLLTNPSFDINVVNKYFARENKTKNDSIQLRSRTSSISTTSSVSLSRNYQILDKSLQISYDVTMRHLLQLLNKVPEQNATIDDVINGIENGTIPNEWLQCVQRLMKILDKQIEKRAEDKVKLKNFNIENIETLNLVEQFFVKLLQLPNSEFKLKSYKYRDEFQSELIFLHQSIDRFVDGIELVLNHEYLPWLFQILCFLYNLVSNKSVPGLDLISIEDALNSPTIQRDKTVAHVLVEILEDYYPEYLTNFLDDHRLTELKKILTIKYEKIHLEMNEIYRHYDQLQCEYRRIESSTSLPSFIDSMLRESQFHFECIFEKEIFIKRGERNLADYFCSNHLSLDICLSTVAHFIDKIHLAHVEKHREKANKYKRVFSNTSNSTDFMSN